MKKKRFLQSIACFFIVIFYITNLRAGDEEGGYVGQQGQGHPTVVYNFLKHFSYEDYYWDRDWCYDGSNNSFVDNMDIVVFGGHGNQWLIKCEDDSRAHFDNCGGSSNLGWGN